MDQSKLDRQGQDFSPETWNGWSYHGEALKRLPAYAGSVAYVLHGANAIETEEANHREAYQAQITPTNFSLTKDGIYVGVLQGPVTERADKEWTRLKFEPRVPLDDSVTGDQPPITGRYPRVEFPAQGWFGYQLLLNITPEGAQRYNLGTKWEEHEICVHAGANRSSITIPKECPCDKEVRAAIANFHEGHEIPQGVYKISMEVERLPLLSVRIDGGRPLSSVLLREGDIVPGLNVMDVFDYDAFKSIAFGGQPNNERKDPLSRSHHRDAKYGEMPMVFPGGGDEQWYALRKVTLRTGENQEETAELTYKSLDRAQSVREVAINPNQGLVEMEFNRVAKLTSIKIEFIPEAIKNPYPEPEDFRADLGMSERSSGLLFSRSFAASTPVNVGRTELHKPKTGPASPTMKAEWDGHLHTFRFCLTNKSADAPPAA